MRARSARGAGSLAALILGVICVGASKSLRPQALRDAWIAMVAEYDVDTWEQLVKRDAGRGEESQLCRIVERYIEGERAGRMGLDRGPRRERYVVGSWEYGTTGDLGGLTWPDPGWRDRIRRKDWSGRLFTPGSLEGA